MNRRSLLGAVLAFVVGAATATPITMHAAGGRKLIGVENGPGGVERVEIYGPDNGEAWFYARGYDMPGRVRLTNTRNSTVLGTSPLLELSGAGAAVWTDGAVRIGSATFDRKKQSWAIKGG